MLLDLLAALAADRWLRKSFMNSLSWCVALVTGGTALGRNWKYL